MRFAFRNARLQIGGDAGRLCGNFSQRSTELDKVNCMN